LKGVVSSKKLLLSVEMQNDKLANNGEALLILGLVWFYTKLEEGVLMGNTVGSPMQIGPRNDLIPIKSGLMEGAR